MSGRRQHYIPQAVQRGFAATGRKKAQVYVFTNGKEPYLSATDRVAAQRDFYSAPADSETLDDQITKYESTVLGPAILALRESEPGPIDSKAAAAVVVHLSIRSAFLRGTFSTVTKELLEFFSKTLANQDQARRLLGVDSADPQSATSKAIEEEVGNALPPGTPYAFRAAFAKLAHVRIREKFATTHASMSAMVLQQFAIILDRMPEIVVSGHTKVLGQGLVPQQRVERLRHMQWRIVAASADQHFVLPDCLALGSKAEHLENLRPYALVGDDELTGVVMPVSSSKVLVGSTGDPRLNAAALNEASARCSLEFFISSRDDAATRAAATMIGTSVSRYIEEAVDETFATPEATVEARSSSPASTGGLLIRFEPVGRKSGKVQAVVRDLLSEPELAPGLGITEYVLVTDNVPQSLKRRGLQLNEPWAPSVTSGHCHIVELADSVKCQLFVPSVLVEEARSKTEASAAAAGLIRSQAGRATYFAHLLQRVPLEVFRRPRPLLEKAGLRIAQAFASEYFGARLSGRAQLNDAQTIVALDHWRKLAAGRLEQIALARAHFVEHKNVDAVLTHILAHAEVFLTSSAAACAAFQAEPTRLLVDGQGVLDLTQYCSFRR
jgi:Protein of unknown function (DUF4238)